MSTLERDGAALRHAVRCCSFELRAEVMLAGHTTIRCNFWWAAGLCFICRCQYLRHSRTQRSEERFVCIGCSRKDLGSEEKKRHMLLCRYVMGLHFLCITTVRVQSTAVPCLHGRAGCATWPCGTRLRILAADMTSNRKQSEQIALPHIHARAGSDPSIKQCSRSHTYIITYIITYIHTYIHI